MKAKLRALEDKNTLLDRGLSDAKKANEAERQENDRLKVENDRNKESVNKLVTQQKAKVDSLESDLMDSKRQCSGLMDHIREYENRYGRLEEIKRKEAESREEERQMREAES